MANLTIADNDARVQYSVGSGGSTGPFTIDFPFFSLDDVLVIVTISGTDTTYTRVASSPSTNQYTVSGTAADDSGYTGGTITLGASVASATVTIYRDIVIARTTDFPASGPFNITTLNTDLDKSFAISQENETKYNRSIRLAESDTDVTMTLPNATTRADKGLVFDSTGNTLSAIVYPATSSATVSTVGVGGSATATTAYNTTTGAISFAFGVPTGATGATGTTGTAATLAVGTVSELTPGATPTVANAGSSSAASLNFGLPGTQIWSTGIAFPGSPADQDLFVFSSDVGSGLTWYDTNGTSALTAATNGDIAKYQTSNTRWVKQTSILGATGSTGSTGTAATIAVGSVTGNTVGAGGSSTAAVANSGSSSAATFDFTFGLPTGATGAGGTNSQLGMTWDNSTADADNGAGKIAWNHATIASATILYVDSADDAGANIEAYVRSWDNVVNSTARGIVTITKEGTPATYATFFISSTVTNATGYTKVPVTHSHSSGSFSDGDGVGVHFNFSGVDGADGSGSMSDFTLTGDSGSNQTIADSNTLDIAGGNSISTVVGATDTVTINADDGTASAKGAVIVAGTSPIAVAYSSGTATVSTGTIPVGSGGTNLTSFTAGDLLYATGSTTIAKLTASGHGSKTLQMNSGATAPEWATVASASVDLNPITQAISMLALRDSVSQNLNLYNLNNSAIDTFQDGSGIGATTTCARTAGEFVKPTASYGTPVYYRPSAEGQDNGQTLTFTNTTSSGAWESGSTSYDYADWTTSATGSGWFGMNVNDSAYQTGGRHTIIQEMLAGPSGGGPTFSWGFAKNDGTHTAYQMNSKFGRGSNFTVSFWTVGNQIKTVYDIPSNEDAIESYRRTSNSGSWGSDLGGTYNADFTSTDITSLYMGGQAWIDSGTQWTIRIWAYYEAATAVATATLISTASTASATVSSASLVLNYIDNIGTATLNTDLIGYVSADNGSNWTAVTLTGGPTFSTGVKVAVSDKVTISNTGTAMKYKIVWANQGGSLDTHLDGISLNY